MNIEMRKAIRAMNKAVRERSICPVCGKPREGLQMPIGGRVIDRGDNVQMAGGRAQTRQEAGLCTCREDVEI